MASPAIYSAAGDARIRPILRPCRELRLKRVFKMAGTKNLCILDRASAGGRAPSGSHLDPALA
jgi:hypothetical protein